MTRAIFFVLLLFVAGPSYIHSNEEETVETWATKLGEEIWELGQLVTRIPEIRQKYKVLNARVLPTDGEAILNTIVTNVNRMMKSKMDAVMCLIEAAEQLSERFDYNVSSVLTYRSAKLSSLEEEAEEGVTPQPIVPKRIQDEEFYAEYRTMQLDKHNHFYGIPVNTDYSAVHVPTDVFDQAENVKEHIQWSEALDEVFVRNYRSDPTLKWQYFGGNSGFLRLYPALRWNGDVDEFDCRTRPWFIEAATCSKDVVILVDNSGSMTGMRATIARQTVNSILNTFSNNDFINIFAFNNVSYNIVPCFTSDMLVQATQENIKTFKEAIDSIKPDGKANFTDAYITAFNLLEQYRERRNCPQRTCNQAVMLVTDSVTDNLTEVFQTYNWFDNRTHVPVRVFTYLIGREVTKVREIQWMACLNRGYYVHIQTLEEAQGQVLKYIPVVARPLVLQGVEHPLSWTHPFADITDPAVSSWLWDVMDFDDQKQRLWNHSSNQNDYFSQRKEDNKYIRKVTQGEVGEEDLVEFQEYRMMTSVSGPAFDRKKNKNNETKSADLLGIAGTDVHIKDIEKLTLAYKIGANGYAFIITNNGYLMSHPDLRPVHKGILKDNYNSVDLTEVELLDDNITDPREPSEEILELRRIMVEHNEGKTLNLKMKFHYDDFRRVGAETRHYYYAPLENTSFSLGLVLPHSYGNYWIKAGDEIRKTYQMGESVADYFRGNWRIHPDWVYCDYHRDTSHWNESREERLVEFMKRMRSPHWKWHEQYPNDPNDEEDVCNRTAIGDDEYYCDKELMQLLVFDGKSTHLSYEQKKYIAKTRRELELVNKYNVSLRFVATQSGLTRWQYIKERADEQNEWGDSNNEALNEPWYRSAVLQHHIDADAFVLSMPFDPERAKTMTASHAIFHRDGGHEAPGSVVGFHFPYDNFYNSFIKIISRSNCPDCAVSCQSDTHDCYVIDGNGYVVWSRDNLTGVFFGDMEGAVMEAMVSKNIFRRIKMFDYQGLCFDTVQVDSSAISLLTPFKQLFNLVMSMSSTLLWYLMELSLWRPVYSYDDVMSEVPPVHDTTPTQEDTEEDGFNLFYSLGDFLFKYYDEIESGGTGEEGGEKVFYRRKTSQVRNTTVARPCDRQGDLYLLQHLSKEGYHSSTIVNCSRPFIVKRIPHTNLLLIVINALYQSCYVKLNAEMTEIEYNNTYGPNQSCQKLYLNTLPRRKLTGCFSEHPLENEIITCGRGSHLEVHTLLLVLVSAIPLLNSLSNAIRRS
ncbi:voltage-dependent calcium channel subunit alpha-2/delta-4 isoform X2 [Nilaparvata lugens]|uniref:voltage-dependent calcium channel subunit alpha-2/delta-4 isoform X2 n=1 Tax=Nilaparvata lugens TaxID=108931 RepID=UPI00193EA9DE|nr:voltage-dependent calcium channel subunit alpha-2/delta-4 isoform X2 [Nilaparvata lugens]